MTESRTGLVADDGPELVVAPDTMAVLEALWGGGHAALVVGGAVRDALLGLPTGAVDIATDARPERVLAIFPDGTYENRFGTVLARGVEITTFRRDHRYADHRRPEHVTFTDDVYEDLARRDLTINAIAWGRSRPGGRTRWVDPADGLADLRARVVRAVGDPDARFDEDALRLLRAVRIAARLGFTVEPRTLQAMRDHAHDVAWVSEERIGSEVRRMLSGPRPSEAFRLLHETGILATALPSIEALASRAGDAGGPLGLLAAAEALAPGRERLAIAALVWGLVEGEPGRARGGQEGALEPADDPVRAILARLRVSTRDAAAVSRILEVAREPYTAAWTDADVRRHLARIPRDLVDDALALRSVVAMTGDRGARDQAAELRRRVAAVLASGAPLDLAALAIDGHDLRAALDLPEGPAIGDLLERALEAVLERPDLNDHATLLALARGWHDAGVG